MKALFYASCAAILVVVPASILGSGAVLAAGPVVPLAGVKEIKLDGLPVVEVVSILMRDVLRAEFVVTPEVSADRRPSSLALDVGRADDDKRIAAALGDMGLTVRRRGGVFVISKTAAEIRRPESMGGGNRGVEKPEAPALLPVVYTPLYRDTGILGSALSAVLPGLKIAARNQDPATGVETAAGSLPDALVFQGTLEETRAALMVLAQIDLPRSQLSIRATVFEVSTGTSKRSAFELAASLLGGKVAISAGGPVDFVPGAAVGRVVAGSFQVALSALNADNRFKAVSSPHVMARSGTESVLISGSSVPVLGAVTVPGDGRPAVQSVEYRDSGVTLRVRPTIYEKAIDIDVTQELSNFVPTTNGVNSSPTLNKRSLVNRLSGRAGDVFLLGGLTQDRVSRSRSGLFGGLIGARSSENEKSEILMLLQVDASPDASAARSEASTDGATEGVNL